MGPKIIVRNARLEARCKAISVLKRLALLGLPLAILFGCAKPVKIVPADTAKIKQIKSIALVERRTLPVQFLVGRSTKVIAGALGGAVGGTLVWLSVTDVESSYVRLINARHINLPSRLTSQIKQDLEALGYEVTVIPQTALPSGPDKEFDFAHARTTADAVLRVGYTAMGYRSSTFRAGWEPMLGLYVQLASRKTGELLYAGSYVVGDATPRSATSELIDVGEMSSFSSSDELFNNIDKSIAEMSQAHSIIGKAMVNRIGQSAGLERRGVISVAPAKADAAGVRDQ